MQWLKSIQSLANVVSESIWQTNCPLCKRPTDQILCKDCDRQITACQSPEFLQPDFPISSDIPLYSWGIYDGALKRAIATCKYENHPEVMRAIAIKIADMWRRSPNCQSFKKTVIIPIPLHDNKLKSRGFNQAEVLARVFCECANFSCKPQLLQRVKDTKAQMQTKTKREREENLAKAFTISPTNKVPESVILFDDIYTTGATISEAIATLAKSNIAVRGVIVIARPKFKI